MANWGVNPWLCLGLTTGRRGLLKRCATTNIHFPCASVACSLLLLVILSYVQFRLSRIYILPEHPRRGRHFVVRLPNSFDFMRQIVQRSSTTVKYLTRSSPVVHDEDRDIRERQNLRRTGGHLFACSCPDGFSRDLEANRELQIRQ